uniref:NADH-ubiquinone oxidoreductase chain 6 n=1 Tax=Stolotermes victoriensis TaxID=2910475 RepID=A0A977KCW8_9NEOP|nr:NADH dehydrogenase subunit 6 [Stolotermes victoriensis]
MLKMLMSMSMLLSMTFTQMKHPMAMGLMLLMQTTLTCMMSSMLHQSTWFSYMLFLTFLGGMLVLFIYVTSLASNEMFFLSTKLLLITTMFTTTFSLTSIWYKNNSKDSNNYETMMMNTTNTMLEKLYNQPTGMMTIILASYLFLTLIVIVKITNISKGPLRKMK